MSVQTDEDAPMSRVSRLARLLWMRPTNWLQAVAYGLATFVLAIGMGLAYGRPSGWLVTAGAAFAGVSLAGLLHVASRSEPEVAPPRQPRTDV